MDIEFTTIVLPFVSAWKRAGKPGSARSEVVECPLCHGKLKLTQDAKYGHVSALCETPNCIAFIE